LIQQLSSEEGSALAEAAIVFPILVLILLWATALQDVLILKMKALEAVRFALWESTVLRDGAEIERDVQTRFADLRSPHDLNVGFTGLLLYPHPDDVRWKVSVDTQSAKVSMAGGVDRPSLPGPFSSAASAVLGALATTVDAELGREGFDPHGKAVATVAVESAGHAGSLGALASAQSLPNLSLAAPEAGQNPMQLVFDTWKAWPKPEGRQSPSPSQTYPVVEAAVSDRLRRVAFLGLSNAPGLSEARGLAHLVGRPLGTLAGGTLPDVFSVARMDGPERGPITILPPETPDVSWAPSDCLVQNRTEKCASHRLGDLRGSGKEPLTLDETAALGPKVDRSRYTLPFRIHTQWWTRSGGTNAGDGTGQDTNLRAPGRELTDENAYVRTWNCRGHFFSGSQRAQEADPDKRYGAGCDE
jgi:hypothetical protein